MKSGNPQGRLSFESFLLKEFRRPVSYVIANARAGQGFVAVEAT
jgi:hypothetical protein